MFAYSYISSVFRVRIVDRHFRITGISSFDVQN